MEPQHQTGFVVIEGKVVVAALAHSSTEWPHVCGCTHFLVSLLSFGRCCVHADIACNGPGSLNSTVVRLSWMISHSHSCKKQPLDSQIRAMARRWGSGAQASSRQEQQAAATEAELVLLK